MGMICGGQVRVLIHFVDASEDNESRLYGELGRIQERHGRGWLVTRLPECEGTGERPEAGLLGKEAAYAGNMDPVLAREAVARFKGRQPEVVWRGGQGFLVEPLSTGGTVVIFGAGHVSLELASLTGRVGFRTVVLDDREEFANRGRFASAEEIHVIESFDRAMDGLEINDESYLVLVTRGHAHDRTVLAQALRTGAGYIGMIGSRRKRDAIYEALLGEGLNRRDLERVHCPVGLDIGAETPEEIAVSILAELIQVRARKP
jgi:xanthine dehydrogenase accessory factor